jgi:hypothetical protein
MPPLLIPSDFPSIRAAIDVVLSATILPDTIIGLPIYRGLAERDIRATVPDADAILAGNDDRALALKVAAIYTCAAYLVPAVPWLTSSEVQGVRASRRVDPVALAKDLKARAAAELAVVLGVELDASDTAYDFFFTTAPGDRGRLFGRCPEAARGALFIS